MTLTAEQLEQRKQGIGASEMPALMGVDPYRSAIDVYLEKTGQAPPFDGNQYTYWGNVLEPAIANRYAELNDVEVVECGTLVHPVHPWMMATPDRIVKADPERGLECKNRGGYNVNAWGEPGSDEIPDEVAIQGHASMAVTGLRRWDVAVLLGGNQWASYVLEYDKELAESLIEVGRAFWHENVLAGVCPELDGSESSTNYVNKKWSLHGDLLVQAEPEIVVVADELRQVRIDISSLEIEKEHRQNLIKDAIGESAGIILPDGKKITWKAPKVGEKVDWQAVAKDLAERFVPEEEYVHTVNQHTTTTTPSRRFVCPRNW